MVWPIVLRSQETQKSNIKIVVKLHLLSYILQATLLTWSYIDCNGDDGGDFGDDGCDVYGDDGGDNDDVGNIWVVWRKKLNWTWRCFVFCGLEMLINIFPSVYKIARFQFKETKKSCSNKT